MNTATMVPARYRVVRRDQETADTVTLTLTPVGLGLPRFRAGQFAMVYAFGVGEVPISVSGYGPDGAVHHTIRAVGAVSDALCRIEPGTLLGLRGPFGTDWGLPAPPGSDLLVIGGGIGLAPLRPVIAHALEHSGYRRRTVLVGARTPGDLLYPADYPVWRAAGLTVAVSVDRPAEGWSGPVGVVTTLLDGVELDPDNTVAFVCGPEVMMLAVARDLCARGMRRGDIRISLERNMRCGIGVCGHCQVGRELLCRDGPVLGYDQAASLMEVREL